MINQQTLEGNWNEIAGKLRSKWGQLTQDELQQFEGNATQLVGYIQRKTGETKDKIEKFINTLASDGSANLSHAAQTARDFAAQAAHVASDGMKTVAGHVRDGYGSAQKMVHERPATSVAAAFGVGLFAGVIVGLVMRSR